MNKISKKIKEFIGKIRPGNLNIKRREYQNSDMAFLKGRKMVCNLFESGIFS